METTKIDIAYKPLYQTKKRYILITGGRASLKSTSVHDFIARLTYEKGHGILMLRYTMTSAEKSVIPEFKLTLQKLGIEKDFKITREVIINEQTGSFIYFAGVKTSSGDQTAKLKSIPGITTMVVEEGEDFTDKAAFKNIDRSIRTKDKQNRVIWIMNPTFSGHFIYQDWIKNHLTHKEIEGINIQTSTHQQVEHIHTTYHIAKRYLSNDWLLEANLLKEENRKEYDNAYLGQWKDYAEGVIFDKWTLEKFPNNEETIYYGLDWGFAEDPLAMVQICIKAKKLYVKELIYEKGLTNADLLARLVSLKINKHDYIIADSAEPKSITDIWREGYNIIGAKKGDGSINYGINLIKKFELCVDPGSVNLQTELRNYQWSKDRLKEILPKPIDKWNHAIDALRYSLTIKESQNNFFVK